MSFEASQACCGLDFTLTGLQCLCLDGEHVCQGACPKQVHGMSLEGTCNPNTHSAVADFDQGAGICKSDVNEERGVHDQRLPPPSGMTACSRHSGLLLAAAFASVTCKLNSAEHVKL